MILQDFTLYAIDIRLWRKKYVITELLL